MPCSESRPPPVFQELSNVLMAELMIGLSRKRGEGILQAVFSGYRKRQPSEGRRGSQKNQSSRQGERYG